MNPKTIIVLGLDEKKKPRAAQFDIALAEAVRKAAKLMGFRTAIPKTDAAQQLAAKAAAGKLFATANGKGLVPYVKTELYEQLLDMLELESEGINTQSSPTSPSPTKAPSSDLWTDLKVGSVVIAPDRDPSENGWWPAVIVSIAKDTSKLTLRWVDSKLPSFTARRGGVAIPPPKS